MTSADFQSAAFSAWLASVAWRVNNQLAAILAAPAPAPALVAAMGHAALNGGKRIRPALLLAVAEGDFAHPGQSGEARGRENPAALSAACALELAHCYSLVHDDLPAMDNADTRRGRPACHRQHGEARAILAGDCLQSLAFEMMAESLPAAIPLLARALGANGMGGGQSLDLDGAAENEADLAQTHQLKTGRLFLCALQSGLLCRQNEGGLDAEAEAEALNQFGDAFGLMFQICDDLRGEKDDKKNGRKTYATLLGQDAAKERAADARKKALAALGGKHPKLAAVTEMIFAA